jgi:hypothetical protein
MPDAAGRLGVVGVRAREETPEVTMDVEEESVVAAEDDMTGALTQDQSRLVIPCESVHK